MGVDYNGVGGVGIKLSQDDINILIDNKVFTQEEWDDDWYECFEKLPVSMESAGDYCYTGDEPTIYLLLDGVTIDELYENVPVFLEELKKLGLERTREDIKVIEDIKIW